MDKWYRGYIWVGLALLLPSLAKLTAPSTIDAIMFFVIGVVVWGSVLSAILFAWDKFRGSGSSKN